MAIDGLFVICCILLNFCSAEQIWHSYQFESGYANREELVITKVTTDNSFAADGTVLAWRTLAGNGKVFGAGLLDNAMVLLNVELSQDGKSFVARQKVAEFPWKVTAVEMFQHWNTETRKLEIILISAIINDNTAELRWYKLNDLDLEHFWTWPLQKKISHMQFFQLESDKCRLLILNDTADVYEFSVNSLTSPQFWLSQTLQLSSPANSSAINSYGSDMYLSIPQQKQNEVLVYKLIKDHFEFWIAISSNNVNQVASFKIGFKSFLAINGDTPSIYKFVKDNIELENVNGIHLTNVEFWLPVPVKTYRDEVALILQRTVDHDTYKSHSLEAVLYDGHNFNMHEEIPCSFFGEAAHGLDCMVDEDGFNGLLGAAVVSLKDVLGILVPHKSKTIMFMVETVLKQRKGPVELEVEKLIETRQQLQKMISEQKAQIESIQKRLETTPREDDVDRVTILPVYQEEVTTVIVPLPDDQVVHVGDLKHLTDDFEKNLSETKAEFGKIAADNEAERRFGLLNVYGDLQALGSISFQNINTDLINDESVEEVLRDTVQKNAANIISGHKTINSANIGSLTFRVANGINSEDLLYKTDQPLRLNGRLVFENQVEVFGDVTTTHGNVNDIRLMNEVVEMKRTYNDTFEFEHVIVTKKLNTSQANSFRIQKSFAEIVGDVGSKVETLDLDSVEMLGDITVENVNGENFELFKKSLRLRDVDSYIPGETFMADNVIITGAIDAQYLNGVKFPEDHLFTNSEFSTITGQKNFLSPLHVEQLIIEGSLNGIRPDNIVTLSTSQSLPGNFLFTDLEVTEVINVKDEVNITGSFMEKFLPNPGLLETNRISARANFRSLIVEGSVIVSENYNNKNLQDLLQDVIYLTDSYAHVTSVKNFTKGLSVSNGIISTSERVGGIPLSSIITTNTEQTILMQTLNGAVVFQNLLVQGLYSGINITKLDLETVKLSGDQFLPATLVFENDGRMVDLTATKMEISGTLNEFPVANYFYDTDGSERDMEINLIDFSKIQARNVIVEGSLAGSIDNFSLEEFDKRRLSATRQQTISAKYTAGRLHAENLIAKWVNGELFEKLFDRDYYLDLISDKFVAGDLFVKNINVIGNLSVEQVINGEDVTELVKSPVWTDKNNNFTEVTFAGDLFVNHFNLKHFNGVPFKLFTDNVIYKDEKNPVITGFKNFVNGFRVTRMLNSEYLNGIHVDNILMKTGEQAVKGPVTITGNVIVNYDTVVDEGLNGVPLSYLRDVYHSENNTCVINDDLMFQRVPYINNLIVEGYVNDLNLEEFLQDVVYKTQSRKIPNNVTFLNKVHVKQNLNVRGNINNVDFSEFVEDVAVITKDSIIGGDVTFIQPVYAESELMMDNLETKYLSGVDLDSWKENAVLTNRGIIPGKLTFEYVTMQGEVYLNFINDIDLNALVPLRTDQHVNQSLEFLEISPLHNISVQNRVNGYVLPDEYYNSIFMDQRLHEVYSDITFANNVLVRNNLQVVGLSDGRNLSNAVTTNTEQRLTANYEFDCEVTMNDDIEVGGQVNGVNVREWNERGVKTDGVFVQTISDNWTATNGVVFGENVFGDALLQGIDVVKLADTVEQKRILKVYAEDGITGTYENVCKDVSAVMKRVESQIYLFKYFDYLQRFKFEAEIENIHQFKSGTEDYLLVTEESSCTSHLFAWFKTEFSEISIIKTGTISQMITVKDGDYVFLVSKSSAFLTDCRYFGTNIWKFDHQELVLLHKLENYKLLQDSLISGTFYALSDEFVVEYHLHTKGATEVKNHRKWRISEDNWRFVPRGSGLGLSLSNGRKLLKLSRHDSVEETEYGYETDVFLRGNIIEEYNGLIPPAGDGDIITMNVGIGNHRKSVVAVGTNNQTSVKEAFDFIKIYEDLATGKLFQNLPAYKPSSLLSLEPRNNGETLLLFLEDNKLLQVYEYKGFNKYKHKTTVKMPGTNLFSITVPTNKTIGINQIVGVVNKKELTLLKAVMVGNRISIDHPDCKL
ncbi:uncharacterized protein LOC116169316 [Photinus pyralis]|uniref:uncharacterized protein LOC116169316 n=1 Tax=Photinus pyralis TaxID=7054 RepID=UPI0012676845|nr:uncharacterized protein LOC116169316 [Photinus pyralis]